MDQPHIIALDDSILKKIDATDFFDGHIQNRTNHNKKRDFYHAVINNVDHSKRIIINPHCIECELYCEILMQIKIYCIKNKIKLLGFGNFNHFPLLSHVCDEVVLFKNFMQSPSFWKGYATVNDNLDEKLCEHPDYLCVESCQVNCSKCKHYNKGPHAPRGRFLFPEHMNWDKTDCGKIRKECFKIQVEDLIAEFSSKPVFILKSGLDFFKKLPLGENIVYWQGRPMKLFGSEEVIQMCFPGIRNIDPTHELLDEIISYDKEARNYYMTVQLLTSALYNWRYILNGGCSHIFSSLPFKYVVWADRCHYKDFKFENMSKELQKSRFGYFFDHYPLVWENWTLNESNYKSLEHKIRYGLELFSDLKINVKE